MSDPWSDALQEAYTYASGDDPILATIELSHPTFTDSEDNIVPLRMVNAQGDLLHEGDQDDPDDLDVFGYMMGIESTATYNPSETVEFVSVGFKITLPKQEEGRLGTFILSFDNVTRLISQYLDKALTVRAPLSMVYREYLDSDKSQPHIVVPLLTIKSVSSTMFLVEAVAEFNDLVNKRFPNLVYRPQDFPGLVS